MDQSNNQKDAKSLRNKNLMYRLILINIEGSESVNKLKALVKSVSRRLELHSTMKKNSALIKPLICAIVNKELSERE